MAISCGGILCGVSFFIGFMLLSEMIESSVGNAEFSKGDDMENIVFSGNYKFSTSTGREVEGKSQLRAVSKPAGMPDIAVSSIDLRFRHDTYESELAVHQGLLVSKELDSLEFMGTGETSPFMFSLSESESSCELNDVKLSFIRRDPSLAMECMGTISSKNCGFEIKLSMQQVNLRKLRRKIVNYSILTNSITLGLIKLYIDQIRLLDSNSNFARIAIGSIVMQSITDSLDSMMNFFIGLSTQFLFNIFIIISLFKFILFSFFEMRLIILSWRQVHANEINSLDPYDAAHVERTWIQTRMYLPLIACLILLIMYPVESSVPLVVASQLYWVPQIFEDAFTGHKSALTNQFILGVSVCRLVLPMYMWGCPDTIFNGEVIFRPPGGPGVAILIFLLQIIQVGLMLTQRRFGPRWFVPWMFLPHVYNYYRKVELDEEFGVPECVVFMSEIDLKNPGVKDTVITPCGHLFHSQCLGEWMNLRQECPLCRRELPPIT